MQRQLIISKESFFKNLSSLVSSGVTFEAEEKEEDIIIDFTGGY